MYDIPFDKAIQNLVTLQAHTSTYVDTEKEQKLVFLTRQLELLSHFYHFQSYPKCNYEQLRDFLVLRQGPDVKELYESKKGNILTTTTLTQFAVNPSEKDSQKNAVLLQTSVKKARLAD
ncbi:hypothetical protein FHG87_017590 [Trinorchestia longiramus]|nr:hypothetical protein FHG87_017590 [Trinorchestia longiramus]